MNTRPTPSVVTDDGLVERVAIAIERADVDRNMPEGTIDHPEVSSWGEHLARAALAASDRDVLVGRIARLREALQDLRDNITVASLVRNPLGIKVRAKADAALIPLEEEL